MRYLDTSVLLAYLLREEKSPCVQQFIATAGAPFSISAWTEVEMLSALGRKIRVGGLSEGDASDVLSVYTRWVSPRLLRYAVMDENHRRAAVLLGGWKTTLRAGDALHLAISSANGATLFTLDKAMASAGTSLGLAVSLLP